MNAKKSGNNTAIIEPIVGIKFNINIISAQKRAKSTHRITSKI